MEQYQNSVVDEDNDLLSHFQDFFTKQGFIVEAAHNGIEEGLGKFREADFDIALIDINSPDIKGLKMRLKR